MKQLLIMMIGFLLAFTTNTANAQRKITTDKVQIMKTKNAQVLATDERGNVYDNSIILDTLASKNDLQNIDLSTKLDKGSYTGTAEDLKNEIETIKSNNSNEDYLPLSGGTLTGNLIAREHISAIKKISTNSNVMAIFGMMQTKKFRTHNTGYDGCCEGWDIYHLGNRLNFGVVQGSNTSPTYTLNYTGIPENSNDLVDKEYADKKLEKGNYAGTAEDLKNEITSPKDLLKLNNTTLPTLTSTDRAIALDQADNVLKFWDGTNWNALY